MWLQPPRCLTASLAAFLGRVFELFAAAFVINDIPGESNCPEAADSREGNVDLPPAMAMGGHAGECVMVVVPSFTIGD